MTFEELKVKHEIIRALKEMGIETPTKIQREAIPLIKQGIDVIGMSNTGSGKTAAFGIPTIEAIHPRGGVQMLVMAPTRELAVQIAEELGKFGKYLRLNIATIFGGVSLMPQIRAMDRAEIIVGTPGRLLDHLERRNINLSRLNCVVLDEADKMVEMGFIEDVDRIIQAMPKEKQVLLFGATISNEIEKIKRKYMTNPQVAKAETFVKQNLLSQFYYDIEPHEKFSILVHLLQTENTDRSLIFCAKRSTVENLTKNLRRQGLGVEMLHGKLTQNRRLKVINDFKQGRPKVLVASSVAARGLDIKELSHVFNYELSRDPQEYIHRVGRTARAGDSGRAITLLTRNDHDTFNSVLRTYKVDVEALEKMNFPKLKFDVGRREFGRGKPKWANNRNDKPKRNGFSKGKPKYSGSRDRDSGPKKSYGKPKYSGSRGGDSSSRDSRGGDSNRESRSRDSWKVSKAPSWGKRR